MTTRRPQHPLPAQLRLRLHRAAATLHAMASLVPDDLDPGLCEVVAEVLSEELAGDIANLAMFLGDHAQDALGLRVIRSPEAAPADAPAMPQGVA